MSRVKHRMSACRSAETIRRARKPVPVNHWVPGSGARIEGESKPHHPYNSNVTSCRKSATVREEHRPHSGESRLSNQTLGTCS